MTAVSYNVELDRSQIAGSHQPLRVRRRQQRRRAAYRHQQDRAQGQDRRVARDP
jgi:hypothetical protein